MFWAELWKDIRIFIWKISVFGGEIFCLLEYAWFRNDNVRECLHYFFVEAFYGKSPAMLQVKLKLRLVLGGTTNNAYKGQGKK